MAVERGYEQRTMPSVGAAQPLPTAENYGAGLGRAVGALGDDMHRRDIRAEQLDRQMAAADEAAGANRSFAQYRIADDEWRAQRQQQGFDGYAKDVTARINEGKAAALQNVREDSVRRSVEAQYDAYAVMEHDRASAWEQGQRIAAGVVQDETIQDAQSGIVGRDPSKLSEEFGFGIEAIDQKPYPPALKAQLKQRLAQKLYGAAGEALAVSNPAQLQEEIAAGKYDLLGATGLRVLVNRMQGTVTRQNAQTREGLETMAAAHDAGEVFTPDQWQKGVQQAIAIGDEPLAIRLRGKMEDAHWDLEYGPSAATPIQRQQRTAALAAKGDQRTQEENREYQWHLQNDGKYNGIFNGNSMGAMIERGGIASIDWNDPASLTRRSQDRRAASQAAGTEVNFASNEEIAPLKAQYEMGRKGQLAVLRVLDGIADDRDRDRAARQIATGNDGDDFRHLAQVRPAARDIVIRGQEELKSNPQLLTADATLHKPIKDMMTGLEGEMRWAMQRLPGESTGAAVATAREWLAGAIAGKGRQSVNQGLTEAEVRASQRASLGGWRRQDGAMVGGVGHWNPTKEWPGGVPYVLQDGYTAQEFAVEVRADRLRQDAAGHGPVDLANNAPMNLALAWPIMIAPGRYIWETKAGTVKRRDGSDYVSAIGARGR